jgi:UDP-N-acetylmuramoyl-L-alanyl-D-glutamate--2,6-diaminopimelate ligase
MPSLPGRLERYELKNGATCIIDYAHTPDSYEQLLSLLRTKTDHLMVLFGAGGARDKTKRPIMGAIAARYADTVLLTSDNPRMEDPAAIIEDIKAGISLEDQKNKVIVEIDREKAITIAYQYAQKGGIIALLGKGPDEYQLVHHQKIPFSEKAIIKHLDR